MDALQAILTRRSVRAFTAQPVSPERITQLLEAAMQAPSACNQQPWQFIVITDRKTLDELPAIHPHAEMSRQAALAIIVCGDLSLETCKGYWAQDCSAATQNLLLAAHALGLGAVWTGIYPVEDRVAAFRKRFGLPDHVIPLCLVPIGYPAEPVEPVSRYKPERIHANGW